MSKVLVPLAQGCEELEAITITDLLVRAGIEVTTAGLDENPVRASRGATLIPDTQIDKVINAAEKKGYTVEVMYITADRPELIARNIVRTFTRNRVVKSEDMLTEDVVKRIENNYDTLNEKQKRMYFPVM